MNKYAKIINEETGLCEVGVGSNKEFYKSIGMTKLDVEQSEVDGNWYVAEKCPHYTEEELAQKEKSKRIGKIKLELETLDAETVRPLRAEMAGTATDEDIQKLKDIEDRAKALRIELNKLDLAKA